MKKDGLTKNHRLKCFIHKKLKIMATLTNQQIEQKKQLLAEKMKEMKAIYNELAEAGAIEISEEDLENVAGGIPGLLPGSIFDIFR
jgi:hypothetical protein